MATTVVDQLPHTTTQSHAVLPGFACTVEWSTEWSTPEQGRLNDPVCGFNLVDRVWTAWGGVFAR